MTRVTFISADGEDRREVVADAGQRLLELAQVNDQPLEGTCEGQMACSTCHVLVAPEDFAKLPPATDMEEDLLDLASHVTRYSRLACQIELTDRIDSLVVRMPGIVRNMQGR
jgi:ferredoxin